MGFSIQRCGLLAKRHIRRSNFEGCYPQRLETTWVRQLFQAKLENIEHWTWNPALDLRIRAIFTVLRQAGQFQCS